MAFTETQRVQIRFYLGFPDVFQSQNSRLESAMDVIGQRVEAQANVEAILTNLEAADTALATTVSAAAQNLKKVDEVEFYQEVGSSRSGTSASYRNGRMFVGRLSIAIGVPIQGDVFGGAGYQGDSWQGRSFQYGGEFSAG